MRGTGIKYTRAGRFAIFSLPLPPLSLYLFSNRSLAHRGSSLDGVGMNYNDCGAVRREFQRANIYIYIFTKYFESRELRRCNKETAMLMDT